MTVYAMLEAVPFAFSQDLLYSIKCLSRDDRRVLTFVLDVSVGYAPDVVSIAQHLGELGERQRRSGAAGGWCRRESLIGQQPMQLPYGIFASRVKLEGPSDKRSPFLVHHDDTYFPVTHELSTIE